MKLLYFTQSLHLASSKCFPRIPEVYSLYLTTGYYTHINTLADVQENVMEYLHVLSRPMVIDHDHDIIWTEAYMDSVVRVDGVLLVNCLSDFGVFLYEDFLQMGQDIKRTSTQKKS